MKRKILTMAIMAVSMLGFSAMARSPKGNKAPKAPCPTASCDTSACAPAICDADFIVGPNFFEGITLTEAQQTKIQGINQNRDSLRRANFQARKDEAMARRGERQKADSARIAARQADQRAYLAQIKEVLLPDQYVAFLENYYVNTPARPQKGVAPGRGDKDRIAKAHFGRHGDRDKVRYSGKRDGKRFDKAELRKDGARKFDAKASGGKLMKIKAEGSSSK